MAKGTSSALKSSQGSKTPAKLKIAAKKPAAGAEKPKRLTPKDDVLRRLYLLSGNNCAMHGCDAVIVDGRGVVVGHVCHIRAALPDGARFDEDMSNEQRRGFDNLVLMCSGHHKQIDSKVYEKEYDLARVTRIKAEHEAKFKGIDDSLRHAFKAGYADATDAIDPTSPGDFARFDEAMNEELDEEQAAERAEEVADYIAKLRKVPDGERDFMLGVIRRAGKLDGNAHVPQVHVDDLMGALGLSGTKLKSHGKALDRLGVGDLDLVGFDSGDDYGVTVNNPSSYLTWFDIANFCDAAGEDLGDFVLHLKFGLLRSKA